MSFSDLPEKSLLRPEEVAEFLSLSKTTIYRWCESGKLESIILDTGVIRILRESVLDTLNKGRERSVDTPPTPPSNNARQRRVLDKGVAK